MGLIHFLIPIFRQIQMVIASLIFQEYIPLKKNEWLFIVLLVQMVMGH